MRPTTCIAALLAMAPSAALAADSPAPTPSPAGILCPAMSGLEVGQSREAAYESMWRKNPQKPVLGHDVSVFNAPRHRRYTVQVTFDSDAADARVASLYYVFDPPPGLREGISERYGPPTAVSGDASVAVWNVPACGVRIRYRVHLSDGKRPLAEEMWVERLFEKGARPQKK
jgi:hypothetical protein